MSRDYITCHILDTVTGLPAPKVRVELSRLQNGEEIPIATGHTDNDGRISNWESARVTSVIPGAHKIKFETGPYLSSKTKGEVFFPVVEVVFVVSDPPQAHYHIPLLLSNYSYSTYRGS
ncbi:5-hydroxyisourate hydrolase [Wickerhamiella sorbophila]|uniref:5-hydroxyisourate hydrolase n=1 Tax=Wickerhamiella sorbophila TaxID=45607 RepID=A0A2T0FBR4_9ASCO|nr:5-hydroxyisourate hydrolase [Wickerhamiella sorbophila]PRT52452.1 5-hydroxyisourate hydrolase [Wickerhamiella sorbophila]